MAKLEELDEAPILRKRPVQSQAPASKPLVDISDKQKKKKRTVDNDKGDELSEDEDEEGEDAGEPIFLESLLLSFSLTFLHAILEYVVHIQYDFKELYTVKYVAKREVPFFLALLLVIYITSRLRANLVTQIIFGVASAASGVALIHFSEGNETFGTMLQTPGLAVIWIYCVIQMKLGVAVGSLIIPLIFYFKDHFLTESSKLKSM
ncbi:hypothetical protein HDU76_006231 [Blyttiomyces sp. JEL0837]|nr:hypothetical protein HDU76_006231 [Blyttiomyces sp. JEL0837]